MLKTVQAVLDKEGRVQFLESVSLEKPVRVLITFLEEELSEVSDALLSEAALWKTGNGQRKTKHGSTCSASRSACVVSFF